ncbi:MAG: hypothetical protein WAM89_19255 [Terriglobales bacterium]
MRLRRQFGRVAGMVLIAAMFVASAEAQVLNSAAKPISLTAVLNQSLTVTLSSSAVNFNLTAGSASNPGNTSITATTSWVLNSIIGLVSVYAFFGNANAALTDGAGDNIPSAEFQISDNGGAFTALTNTAPFGGANAGLTLANVLVLGYEKGSRTDVMKFNINLSPLPALPPGDYAGTLTIQAQAF